MMSKRDRVRVAEHLGNDWAVRKHSARRAVEAAERQQEAMDRSVSTSAYQSQMLATLVSQNNAVMQQNQRLIELGERQVELLAYLADRAFEESQGRGADSPVD